MNEQPIDHREMAVRCMDRASRTEESDRGASLYWLQRAQVHATLASIPAPPKLSLEQMDAQLSEHVRAQFTALRELREAVRPALGYLDQSPAGAVIADRLRELMR